MDGRNAATLSRDRGLLWKGLGLPLPPPDPDRAWYYVELDLEVWARHMVGEGFFKFLVENYEPVDFLFRVAERSSVVLMDAGGFGGPKWSIRVSLANLNDGDYTRIGEYMMSAAQEYIAAWKASK